MKSRGVGRRFRRFFVLGVPVWLLAACTGPRAAPNAPVKGDVAYHSFVVVERLYSALLARDLAAAVQLCAADVELCDLSTRACGARGREAVVGEVERWLRECPDPTIDVEKRSYAERGRVVTDVQRLACDDVHFVEQRVTFEVENHVIVRVWRERADVTRERHRRRPTT